MSDRGPLHAWKQAQDWNPNVSPQWIRERALARQRDLNARVIEAKRQERLAAIRAEINEKTAPQPLPNPFHASYLRRPLQRRSQDRGEMQGPPEWNATAEEIFQALFDVTGMVKRELTGPQRFKSYVRARYVAMFLLQRHRRLSTTKIGQIFNRDHSTVVHGTHRVWSELGQGGGPILDLLRKVEGALKVPPYMRLKSRS